MAPKVLVRDLHKRYGHVAAAAGVSFDIEDGEIFGLIGPNGAGKTTAVECILGLRTADSGTIHVCGIDVRTHPLEAREKIGAALQAVALQDKITPREALALFGAFYRIRSAPDALLDRFGLVSKADAAFDTLSGGQKQRLALALAFVNRPELVFLDEPTAGLDPDIRRDLRGEILRMKRDGHTVLLTTHDIEEAEALCDRIAIIDRGKVIATGTPRELVARSQTRPIVIVTTNTPVDANALVLVGFADNITCTGHEIRFRTTRVGRAVAELSGTLDAMDVDLLDVHVEHASLEDVLLELTTATPSR